MIGGQVSWFEFAREPDARGYFEAARHAKEAEDDHKPKRAWLERRDENGDWVLSDGVLPIPSTFEEAA